MFAFLVSACAVPTSPLSSKPQKKASVTRPLPWSTEPPPQAFDFKERCGVDSDKPTTGDLFTQSMKSLNFIINANIGQIQARIEAQATLQINGKSGSTVQAADVKILKAYNTGTKARLGSNLITSIGAKIVAKSHGGTQIWLGPAFKDWVLLTSGDNPEYKDLICAVTGTASVEKSGENAQKFTFTPAGALGLNPLASKEEYIAELGSGRDFHVTANAIDPKSGAKTETTTGKVSIMPVNPVLNAVDPVTNQVVQVIADSAWAITSDFTTTSKKFEMLTHKTTFYINHKDKAFVAIVQEGISQDASQMAIPPVILLLQK